MKLKVKHPARELARKARSATCAHPGEHFRFYGPQFPKEDTFCAACAIDHGALRFADWRLAALRQSVIDGSIEGQAALAVFGTPGQPRLLFGPLVTAPPTPEPGQVNAEDAWALYFAEKTRGTAEEVRAAFVIACMPYAAPQFIGVYVSGQTSTARIDWVLGPKGTAHRVTNLDRQHPVLDGLCGGPLDELFEDRPSVRQSLGTLVAAAVSLLRGPKGPR